MANIDISQVREYSNKYWTKNLSPKVKKLVDEKSSEVNNVITYNKPSVNYMINILKKTSPKLFTYLFDLFEKQSKINTFEEYMSDKYWQIWESLNERKKDKEWPFWDYYTDWISINQSWDEVIYDIFRKTWDIKDYCKENSIDDFKFLWWGFDKAVK